MNDFDAYLSAIENVPQRIRTKEVLDWVIASFRTLQPRIAWNQPMFTDHGTFIIGFSISRHHLAVSPERAAILHFSDVIKKAGFEHSQQLIRMPWERTIDYELLDRIIRYNISDKADCVSFWRK